MRPGMLRRLLARLGAIALMAPLLALLSAQPAAASSWHEKDFGTVCKSATSVVQLRVVYEADIVSQAGTYNEWTERGQRIDQVWIRAYDTQDAKLVARFDQEDTSLDYIGHSGSNKRSTFPYGPGGTNADGTWQRVPSWYTYTGRWDTTGPGWGRVDYINRVTFWLNNNVVACTVDITNGYQSPTRWPKADCGGGVVLDSVKQQAVVDRFKQAVDASGGAWPKTAVRAAIEDPCIPTRAIWRLDSTRVTGVKAGELPGNTVINTWHLELALPIYNDQGWSPPLHSVPVTLGTANLQKTWYWRDGEVVNSAGQNPDPAALTGYVNAGGNALGFSWEGAASGSVQDVFQPYQGNGRGQHLSSRLAQFYWRIPFLGFTQPWVFARNMGIVGRADGTLDCTGGTSCRFPN